jgi:hypothetical protein
MANRLARIAYRMLKYGEQLLPLSCLEGGFLESRLWRAQLASVVIPSQADTPPQIG